MNYVGKLYTMIKCVEWIQDIPIVNDYMLELISLTNLITGKVSDTI